MTTRAVGDRLTGLFGPMQPAERPGWAKLANLERLVVVVTLGVLAGAYVPLLQRMAGVGLDVEAGDRTTQMLLLPPYLYAVGWLVAHPKRAARVARRCLPLLVLLAMAVASAKWSSARDITVRRSLALVATTAFGLYLATRFPSREVLRLIAVALGASAVLSALTAALAPAYGVMPGVHEGAWRGIFADKNVLGRIMVLSTVAFVLLAKDGEPRFQLVYWLVGTLSAALVVLSRSSTAIVVLLCLLAMLPIFVGMRWRTSARWLMLVGAVLAGYLTLGFLLTDWQQALGALGKDATFSGRTALWLAVVKRIVAQPWLGYGYSAFWTGWSGQAAGVWEDVAWEPPHSHNGLLDLCLDLGLVGTGIFLMGFIGTARRALAGVRAAQVMDDAWPLVMVSFMLLYNLTESALVRQNSIFWALYAAAAFTTAAERAERARRAREQAAEPADPASRLEWADDAHDARSPVQSQVRASVAGPKLSARARRLHARARRG